MKGSQTPAHDNNSDTQIQQLLYLLFISEEQENTYYCNDKCYGKFQHTEQ